MRKILLAILALIVLGFSTIVLADYAATTVYFSVPISISFTVTLPGMTSNASIGSTAFTYYSADIWFNSSLPTNSTSIQPCVGGGSPCQYTTTPIFQYDNTGTIPINISMKFNATLPTGVEVFMNSTNSSSAPLTTITHGTLLPVNSSVWVPVVLNLAFEGNNVSNAWLFANFTGYTGQTAIGLIHNSTGG